MTIFSPAEIGLRLDYDTWVRSGTPRDKIIVHYGGGPNLAGRTGVADPQVEMEMLRRWERFHIDRRGWRGIAYGWAIGNTGNLYRLRGHADYAAHKGDLDGDGIPENREAFPIVFIIGGDQEPTADALATFATFTLALSGGGLPVFGHREVAELGSGTRTACPGQHLIAYVRQLRKESVSMAYPPQTRKDARRDLGDPDGLPAWAEEPWDSYRDDGGSTIEASGTWPVWRYDLARLYHKYVKPLEARIAELEEDAAKEVKETDVLRPGETVVIQRP